MKILLIRPAPEKETIGLQHIMICEPLELEYLSSAAKSVGAQVRIVDMVLEEENIATLVRTFSPDLVGITGYITHVDVMKKLAKTIKGIHPCDIAVGGVHAEVVPEDFKSAHIDYIIYANGIETFKNLVSHLQQNLNPKQIEGIWHDKAGPVEARLQIDRLFPDRAAVREYRDRYYYMFHNPCALVKTSIGCSFRCKFCFCHKITGGVCKRRRPEHVVEELEGIPEHEIYMVDDNFLHNRIWLKRFIACLKSKQINKKYLVYGRADFIAENSDLIRELKKVGLRAVIVGLESLSREELNTYNKHCSRDINEKAVRILRRNQIECYGTLILGMDWGVKDFFRLFMWIQRLGLVFVNLQPFTPYPGTDVYDQYRDKLRAKRKDYNKWDLAHLVLDPGTIGRRAYYALIVALYYLTTMNPFSILKMIRRYGLGPVIKLSSGSSRITRQYIDKVVHPLK